LLSSEKGIWRVAYYLDANAIRGLHFNDLVLFMHFRVSLAIFNRCLKKTEALDQVSPNLGEWLVSFIQMLKEHTQNGNFAKLL
jgi:hypothetical protein